MTDRYNAFDVVKTFEQQMAEFTGAPFAVAVDSCTAAIFLSAKRMYIEWMANEVGRGGMHQMFPAVPVIKIPRHTFVGVPMSMIHAGYKNIEWTDESWQPVTHTGMHGHRRRTGGYYSLDPLPLYDAALCLRKDMFKEPGNLSLPRTMCLSFQYRKPLAIGRGGMILHNLGKEVDNWFRRARFFGRHEVPSKDETGPEFCGWHLYMEPERAARGLTLLMNYSSRGQRDPLWIEYPDLSKYKVFREHTLNNRQL